MSKDNSNLRLLGSPVNLSYRTKKKSDKNNIRNRPRSALQNSNITQSSENTEKYKRPFSADTTRNNFKTFSTELLHSFNNYPITNIKIVAPTEDLLQNTRSLEDQYQRYHLDNASDFGSEDTFISLGTKIKAKAELNKPRKDKNFVKTRNIAKKNRRPTIEAPNNEENVNDYGLEVKITEKSRSPSPGSSKVLPRSLSPSFKTNIYESYFIPLQTRQIDEKSLAGRVSFGSSNIEIEVEEAIDTYSRRLLTKQQLSLVEEETNGNETPLSHNIPSLTPEPENIDDNSNDINNHADTKQNFTNTAEVRDDFHNTQTFINDTKTYKSFYDDFNETHTHNSNKFKLSSTTEHTDSSSKDSGYNDKVRGGVNGFNYDYSLPSTSDVKKSNSANKLEEPKSLESTSSTEQKYLKTYPMDKKSQWSEPLNHSRLLYKDFFLRKEGHCAQPENSPETSMVHENLPKSPNISESAKIQKDNELEYPSYLQNSTTKAYTSKVIEDYKKELEAINSLHELTIKDMKTDSVSPTPLNIDKMFELHSSVFERPGSSQNNVQPKDTEPISDKNDKNVLENTKNDISKVSTKELIQNYFKVKEGDQHKDYMPKNLLKYDKRISRALAKFELYPGQKQDWNNIPSKGNTDSNIASPKTVNIRNQTQKNVFTLKTPTSARIESVQNDKDVDSWISMTTSSPRVSEINNVEDDTKDSSHAETKVEEPKKQYSRQATPRNLESDQTPNDTFTKVDVSNLNVETKKTELDPNSTVLDIYTMLKDIESFGDNPVIPVANVHDIDGNDQDKKDDKTSTPKDSYTEIFDFLEKVEASANDALAVVTSTTPSTIPKLEQLLKLPQTELAQRLVTASLQLDERSCCIALLQESLNTHKEQMIQKVSGLEKQSQRNIARVKSECEETIKRHQTFIDQLINDKKTLNHRIEQLVDERRSLEDRWKRSAQALEERYKLELRNQHDKMAAAQQVARQRWVRQKAEKIKELTVKGLEGELREMAERQQKEVSDLKMCHAEQMGRIQSKHNANLEQLRRSLEEEKEAALVKERQVASSRMEKQILELELTYQEQRTRLVGELRAENERVAAALTQREHAQRQHVEKWREEQEKLIEEKRSEMEAEIVKQKQMLEEQMQQKQKELEQQFEQFKKDFESEQQVLLKKKVTEISLQHKQERDREIEKAIESMEAEAQSGRRELQEAMRRNKEQYEGELRELAETEKATLRRYQDAQARVRQTEDRCAELEVMVNQLETRNKVITEKNSQLESKAEEIRNGCNEAWQHKVDELSKQMEDARKTHDEQMHQLYAKVKVAVARKDSAIQALTREAAKYQEKITLLEQKLQQQRKDLLRHK